MTTEAADMRDNMEITDKFRGGYGRRKIAAAEMWDNRFIVDRDTGRRRRRQRQRRGMGDRSDGEGEEL